MFVTCARKTPRVHTSYFRETHCPAVAKKAGCSRFAFSFRCLRQGIKQAQPPPKVSKSGAEGAETREPEQRSTVILPWARREVRRVSKSDPPRVLSNSGTTSLRASSRCSRSGFPKHGRLRCIAQSSTEEQHTSHEQN